MAQLGDLTRRVGDPEPETALRAIVALRRQLDQLEAVQVHRARIEGASWTTIASWLGVTKQAVHRRYAGRE